MTLGHVVIGQDESCLDRNRDHERVHVGQYERWGSLMIPLYLLSSAAARLRGAHSYWDNRFEREAYSQEAQTSLSLLLHENQLLDRGRSGSREAAEVNSRRKSPAAIIVPIPEPPIRPRFHGFVR